jgi:ketosteroid isomerase-like protein
VRRHESANVSMPADPDPVTLVVDRLAISDLVHAYAQRVDRREADAVAQLFTEDGTFVAYATPGAAEPTSRSRGRGEITKAIGTARYYRQTTHTIGNHLATVSGDHATGETRCVAYHVLGDEGTETLVVWHIRYLDTYVRRPEGWRIKERVLRVDLVSDQPLRAG